MVKKKTILATLKKHWVELTVLILVFTLIIYLKLRFEGDMVSPYDGVMAVLR